MPKPEKVDLVAKLKDVMGSSTTVVLSDYQGLTVEQMNQLRKNLREKKVRYLIAKNTLFRKAASELGGAYAQLDTHWKGPTAVAFAEKDPTTAAKVLFDFAKDNKDLPALRAGVVDGQIYESADLVKLAKLPGREELLARVVGCINAPLTNLVGTLDGLLRGLVFTIDGIAKAKAKA